MQSPFDPDVLEKQVHKYEGIIKERKDMLLNEYKVLVSELQHIHTIHHALLKYTLPSVAAVLGVSYKVPAPIFTSIVIATACFTVLLYVFYKRLDYLIFVRFSRLVELDAELDFHVYRSIRNPKWEVPSKFILGKNISQMRLYKAQTIIVFVLLIGVIIGKLFYKY